MKFYYFFASNDGFVEAINKVVAASDHQRVYEYGSGYIQIEDIKEKLLVMTNAG